VENNPQVFQEDEIDLRELINVLIKRKKLILTIFFSAVVLTAFINFLIPKIYLSSAIMQRGVVENQLIKKAEAEEMIKSLEFLDPLIQKLELRIQFKERKEAILWIGQRR